MQIICSQLGPKGEKLFSEALWTSSMVSAECITSLKSLLYKKPNTHMFNRNKHILTAHRGPDIKKEMGWQGERTRDKSDHRKASLSVSLHVNSVPRPSGMLCCLFDAFETASSILHRLYHELRERRWGEGGELRKGITKKRGKGQIGKKGSKGGEGKNWRRY